MEAAIRNCARRLWSSSFPVVETQQCCVSGNNMVVRNRIDMALGSMKYTLESSPQDISKHSISSMCIHLLPSYLLHLWDLCSDMTGNLILRTLESEDIELFLFPSSNF